MVLIYRGGKLPNTSDDDIGMKDNIDGGRSNICNSGSGGDGGGREGW